MGAILACAGPQHPQARWAALQRMCAEAGGRGAAQHWSGAHLALCVLARAGDALLAVSEHVVIAVHGRVFDGQATLPVWLDGADLLRLWQQLGDRLVERLGGNFSLLLHEPGVGRSLLASSVAGIHALYLARRGQAWCVASTPWQALAGANLPRTVDAAALARHVLGQPVAEDSCLVGVQRLGALQRREMGADGQPGRPCHWPPPPPPPDPRLDLAGACAELDLALRRTMALQATVPGCSLALSAGLDSGNLLLRLPQQADMTAITLAFAAPHDESAAAARLCASRRIRHQVRPLDRSAARAALADLLRIAQAPVHCAALCNLVLAQAAASEGNRRILLGSGGDELFLFHPGEWRAMVRRPVAGVSAWCTAMRLRPALGLSLRRGITDLLRVLLRGTSALPMGHAGLQNHLLDSSGGVIERIYAASGLDVDAPFYAPAVLALARRLPDLLRIHGGHPKAILRHSLHLVLTDQERRVQSDAPQFLPNWLHNLQIDEFFDNCAFERSALMPRRAFLAVAEGVGWCQPRSMALQDAAVRRWGVTGAARRLSSAAAFALATWAAGNTTTSVQ